ncbi:MAG: hypothetical protein WAT79_13330 [Saprospiraceae bacterium]
MKVAAFNVENLFNRAKIFNQNDNSLSNHIQKLAGDLNKLFEKDLYSAADKGKMIIRDVDADIPVLQEQTKYLYNLTLFTISSLKSIAEPLGYFWRSI